MVARLITAALVMCYFSVYKALEGIAAREGISVKEYQCFENQTLEHGFTDGKITEESWELNGTVFATYFKGVSTCKSPCWSMSPGKMYLDADGCHNLTLTVTWTDPIPPGYAVDQMVSFIGQKSAEAGPMSSAASSAASSPLAIAIAIIVIGVI